MSEPEDPHPITLPAPGTIPAAPSEPKPPKETRVVHVAAVGDAHMAWAMDQVNSRIKVLNAEVVSMAHACTVNLSLEPPHYSTVIAYTCAAWAPPIPPIPPYPGEG